MHFPSISHSFSYIFHHFFIHFSYIFQIFFIQFSSSFQSFPYMFHPFFILFHSFSYIFHSFFRDFSHYLNTRQLKTKHIQDNDTRPNTAQQQLNKWQDSRRIPTESPPNRFVSGCRRQALRRPRGVPVWALPQFRLLDVKNILCFDHLAHETLPGVVRSHVRVTKPHQAWTNRMSESQTPIRRGQIAPQAWSKRMSATQNPPRRGQIASQAWSNRMSESQNPTRRGQIAPMSK